MRSQFGNRRAVAHRPRWVRRSLTAARIASHPPGGAGAGTRPRGSEPTTPWYARSRAVQDAQAARWASYVFKVPSLRNVAMTPPYFHDGSVPVLDEAVKVMARVQLGVTLPGAETAEIVAFLSTLTGPLPASFAAAPSLPPAAVKREP
jgi:hypothetical protein